MVLQAEDVLQNILGSWIIFLWNVCTSYDFGITVSDSNWNLSYLDAVSFTFQLAFFLKSLGKKCLVMHCQKKAEDSNARELIKKCQFETVAL